MRITAEGSTALIIDIQKNLFPLIHENKLLLKNVNILIAGLKALKIPLMVTRQYPKGLGDTVDGLRDGLMDIACIDKITFGCCDEPSFMENLKRIDKRFVIICGIEAHICVMQTVTGLIEAGYQPVVVEDCISSRRAYDKASAVERMRQEGAVITTYESLLYELCRYAGTNEFKEILKLIREG